MVFSSSLFLVCFLPLFLTAYYLTPSKFRNLTALIGSIAFYSWGGPSFIFLILASVLVDYYLVDALAKAVGRRRILLSTISILLNVALLVYFKYANFFVDNLDRVLESFSLGGIELAQIALPIGISFFTFQKISYTIDVQRGVRPPLSRIEDYALYILLFPQLIAGPIVRFNEIADEIVDRRANETMQNRVYGFYRFTIGLAKKVLIANVLGRYADELFVLGPDELTTSLAWLGSVAYAFQIYFDFSGYSDMAIGLGRMMGFTFPENFEHPYISKSITEFWRRWHMTLSRWMRDYLYIPLGGNKVPTWRLYVNLCIVFVISGLWHGAAWNFILWGVFHGSFLILDRLFLAKVLKRIGQIPALLFTFIVTLFGWVLFRSADLDMVGLWYKKMMFTDMRSLDYPLGSEFWVILTIAAFFSFFALLPRGEVMAEKLFVGRLSSAQSLIMITPILVLFIFSWASITSSGFNPFIYFRF